MWLFIEPLDVLLFREGKPFTAGEGVWARGTFPPSPLPFLGAIRSKVLIEEAIDFGDYKRAAESKSNNQGQINFKLQEIISQIGGPSDYGQLQVIGPLICERTDQNSIPYFQIPFDVLLSGESKNTPMLLTPSEFEWPILQNTPALVPLHITEAGEPAEAQLVSAKQLYQYLKNGTSNWNLTSKLWDTEVRVGIELSGGRTAEEGRLYTIEFIRMRSQQKENSIEPAVGFLLKVDGLDNVKFHSSGFLALGGESRGASYEGISEVASMDILIKGEELKISLQGQKGFKLYLASSAIFNNGWFPDFLSESSNHEYIGRLGDFDFKLVTAAVGKAIPIGGWDLVKNRPRSMWKAVPAGSVYFFEKTNGLLNDQDIELLIKTFHFKSLLYKQSELLELGQELKFSEYGKAGFGLALVGIWQQEKK